jgi:RNHCP domain
MTFIKRKEDFICGHCGKSVVGDGYTNHCPHCLWSCHVDVAPGDRLSQCGGMMKPDRIEATKEGFVVIHVCTKCKYEKRNKVSSRDDFSVAIAIQKENAKRYASRDL